MKKEQEEENWGHVCIHTRGGEKERGGDVRRKTEEVVVEGFSVCVVSLSLSPCELLCVCERVYVYVRRGYMRGKVKRGDMSY